MDSNICIAILKHQSQRIRRKLSSVPVGQAGISSIVLAELRYGIEQSVRKKRNEEALADFLEFVPVLDWPSEATHHYGRIRFELKKAGTPIGALDTLIAAHALTLDATLITNNVTEFQRVTDLRIENWLR